MGQVLQATRRLLRAGLFLWLLALPALALTSPATLWIAHYHAVPPPAVLLALACGVVVTVLLARRPRLCDVAITALLGALYFGRDVQPLGDYAIYLDAAASDGVGASDLLSNWLYREVFRAFGAPGMWLVAPVVGVATALLLLRTCDRLFVSGPDAVARKRLCCLSVLAGSWHLLYCHRFVENAQLSVPFLLLALPAWHGYAHGARPRVQLVAGACWLSLASLVHGQNIALAPALPLLAWLGAPVGRRAGARVVDVVAASGAGSLLIVLTLTALHLCGYYLHQGHVSSLLFVPLQEHPLSRHTLLGLSHLRSVGNILLLASPLLPAVPFVLLARRPRDASTSPALLVLALGYAGFTFVILFALNFPRDFDLMLSMGIVLHLFLLEVAVQAWRGRRNRVLIGAGMLVGACYAWAVTSSLCVPRDADAVLFANGRTGEVSVRRDEALVLEVRGLEGTPFVIRTDSGEVLLEGRIPAATRPLRLPGPTGVQATIDPGGANLPSNRIVVRAP